VRWLNLTCRSFLSDTHTHTQTHTHAHAHTPYTQKQNTIFFFSINTTSLSIPLLLPPSLSFALSHCRGFIGKRMSCNCATTMFPHLVSDKVHAWNSTPSSDSHALLPHSRQKTGVEGKRHDRPSGGIGCVYKQFLLLLPRHSLVLFYQGQITRCCNWADALLL
jgi:hypothetical protein